MPYCPNCGSPVKPEERYCFKCGTKIVPVTEPLGGDPGLTDSEFDRHSSDEIDRGIKSRDYEPGRYDRDRIAEKETAQPQPYPPQGRGSPYDSQEGYRKADESVQDQPPVPPQAGVYPGQVQQPQPQVPAKPKHRILSGVGKILEIILYLGFILVALVAIYLLYQFANSINFGV